LVIYQKLSINSPAKHSRYPCLAPSVRGDGRDTINRLLTPDITTLWVVGFLLLCTYLLNSLVFKPILQVIDQRSNAVRGARELADSAAHKATAAAAEYDQKLNAARADVYQQMDDMRKSALAKRADLLAATRATVTQELSAATARVQQESTDARAALDRDANTLAGAIVSRVLGRAS
jgi:F-type H+-transporting ATPase subunit b